MKVLVCLLSFSILGLSPIATIQADVHGGVHVRIASCEEDGNEESEEDLPNVAMELKPWYHHQHFDQYEDINDQAYQLEDDTAWPAQREDFSDYLLR
jgi:hypothetical protein